MNLLGLTLVLLSVTIAAANVLKVECKDKFGIVMDENCQRKWQCVWGNPVLMPNCPLGMVYNRLGACVVKGVGGYQDCKMDGKG